MADRWVINASPIILLAKAEIIEFLPSLCEVLIVPAGVLDEVHNLHISDAGTLWLQSAGKRFVRAVGTDRYNHGAFSISVGLGRT